MKSQKLHIFRGFDLENNTKKQAQKTNQIKIKEHLAGNVSLMLLLFQKVFLYCLLRHFPFRKSLLMHSNFIRFFLLDKKEDT